VLESSKLGFNRSYIGQGGKWLILKAANQGNIAAPLSSRPASFPFVGPYGSNVVSGSGSYRPISGEEPQSRGTYIRSGDSIIIQSSQTELCLTVHETKEGGAEPRLVPWDRSGSGSEVWQIHRYGAQPLPSWTRRPYLRWGAPADRSCR